MIPFLVTACWVPAVLFPVFYLRVGWWKTLPGRAVMGMAVALAVVMTLVWLSVVLGVHLPDWMRLVIYGVMAPAFWYELSVLVYVSSQAAAPRVGADSVESKEPRSEP